MKRELRSKKKRVKNKNKGNKNKGNFQWSIVFSNDEIEKNNKKLFGDHFKSRSKQSCFLKTNCKSKWQRTKAYYLYDFETYEPCSSALPQDNSKLPNLLAIRKCLRQEGRSSKQKIQLELMT